MKTEKEIQNPKEYGAIELKKNYLKNFRRGLEIALTVHVVIICAYLLLSYLNKLNADDNKTPFFNTHIVNVELDAPPPANDEIKDIPKNDEVVKPVKDLAALDPVPVSKDKAEELTIKTQDELNNITNQVSHEGDSVNYVVSDNGNTNITDHIIKDKIDKIDKTDNPDKNFQSFEVEKAPECVNLQMVKSSMEYPPVAIETVQEGRVTVKVLVGPDGNVIQVSSLTGPEVFYDEVKEKARNLEFTPGLQNGKPVKVWVTVPFNFKLKN
jgi:protein TonB